MEDIVKGVSAGDIDPELLRPKVGNTKYSRTLNVMISICPIGR